MVMHFCPECKGILIPKKIGEKFVVRCKGCDFFAEGKATPVIEEEDFPPKEERGTGVLKNENEFADYKNKCKECGYGKAQIIDAGVFISDEDNLILLRCGKCGYSERIGRKTS